MKGNCYPYVEIFFDKTYWNGTTCQLFTGPKKKRKWQESFVIFKFIANNSIFRSII